MLSVGHKLICRAIQTRGSFIKIIKGRGGILLTYHYCPKLPNHVVRIITF